MFPVQLPAGRILPVVRILVSMAHFPGSILTFTSCQIIYIPCLYDLVVWLNGQLKFPFHWPAGISFSISNWSNLPAGRHFQNCLPASWKWVHIGYFAYRLSVMHLSYWKVLRIFVKSEQFIKSKMPNGELKWVLGKLIMKSPLHLSIYFYMNLKMEAYLDITICLIISIGNLRVAIYCRQKTLINNLAQTGDRWGGWGRKGLLLTLIIHELSYEVSKPRYNSCFVCLLKPKFKKKFASTTWWKPAIAFDPHTFCLSYTIMVKSAFPQTILVKSIFSPH